MSQELIFASSNFGKIEEVRLMLPKHIALLGLNELGFYDEIIESGKTFEANAFIKANTIFEKYNKPSFADDSGLEIEALNNEPGVYSARYAGQKAGSAANVELVLEKMKGISNRKARFVCVICLITTEKTIYMEGEVKGFIAETTRGYEGFGYDPIFIPEGEQRTFAEMGSDKHAISHRKKAIQKLLEWIDFI